jgi:hypothetical protein
MGKLRNIHLYDFDSSHDFVTGNEKDCLSIQEANIAICRKRHSSSFGDFSTMEISTGY